MPKLSLADIADSRAYERERAEFRTRIIDVKKTRRVHVGPFVTFIFENADTIRFQIQEMARVEHINTDEGIQAEIDVYNPLIPWPGSLAATMLIELTSDAQLREWLPKLVGIESAVEFSLAADGSAIPCRVDAAHAQQLTRDEITSSVHYVHFDFPPEAIEAFGAGAHLAVTHPEYSHSTELSAATVASLAETLRYGG